MIGPSERGIELVTCFAHGRFVLGVEERRKMVEQQKDDGFDRVLEAHMDMETERAPGNTGKNGR